MRVITVSIEQVRVADGCIGCGRCVAACPNEALHIDGFEALQAIAPGRGPVELECLKVPAALRADAVAVPCLGGVSAGRLAELNERAGDRGVQLVDRGWCGQCQAGCGDAHPAQGAVQTLALWLHALDESASVPRLVQRPLPAQQMPAQIPLPPLREEGPAMSRRQFFRTVAERPLAPQRTAMGSDGRAAFPASARRESPERRRLLDALRAAAQRRGREVPAEFFPRLANNGACVDHRICTAACPTSALKAVEDGATVSLVFDAAACIACGACTRACPEGALSVEPHGGRADAAVVATHTQATCTACGETFSPRAGETLCPSCSKSQRFINDAMAQLFGVRH